ncbi:hypothetical protein B0H66DRAFT_318669 [Apodospora peruviana]|uniref:Uncharacterized protein n=1 Tax=Apodospora peruviana TaxID=516989 RepID=A0AAE0M0S8_9PEZI|nr:hypothetical protein B0H66DRAFT_318669 [Apodospora peruviana]
MEVWLLSGTTLCGSPKEKRAARRAGAWDAGSLQVQILALYLRWPTAELSVQGGGGRTSKLVGFTRRCCCPRRWHAESSVRFVSLFSRPSSLLASYLAKEGTRTRQASAQSASLTSWKQRTEPWWQWTTRRGGPAVVKVVAGNSKQWAGFPKSLPGCFSSGGYGRGKIRRDHKDGRDKCCQGSAVGAVYKAGACGCKGEAGITTTREVLSC